MTNPYEAPTAIVEAEAPKTSDTQPSAIRVFFGSVAAMLPWPLLALGTCLGWSLFDRVSEAMLLFGGVSVIFLLPVGLLNPPEWVFGVLIGAIWVLVLVLPTILVARRWLRPRGLALMYVLQVAFSLLQAGLGLLMVWGKNV